MKRIFIIVGPSGSGKTTIGNELKNKGIPELISHTTRDMREGEGNGVTYYYVSISEFEKLEKIEHSNYSGNSYCLSKKEVEDKLLTNDAVFAITDIHGLEQIKKQYPETVSIFIDVNYDQMIDRMKKRGDNKENIVKRITNAIMNDELENGKKCDYVIKNDNFAQALFEVELILKKELTSVSQSTS